MSDGSVGRSGASHSKSPLRLPPGFAAEVIAWAYLGGDEVDFYGANKRAVDVVDRDGVGVQVKSGRVKKRALPGFDGVVDVVAINAGPASLAAVAERCGYLLVVTTSGSPESTSGSVEVVDGRVMVSVRSELPLPRLFVVPVDRIGLFSKESASERNHNVVVPLSVCREVFLGA